MGKSGKKNPFSYKDAVTFKLIQNEDGTKELVPVLKSGQKKNDKKLRSIAEEFSGVIGISDEQRLKPEIFEDKDAKGKDKKVDDEDEEMLELLAQKEKDFKLKDQKENLEEVTGIDQNFLKFLSEDEKKKIISSKEDEDVQTIAFDPKNPPPPEFFLEKLYSQKESEQDKQKDKDFWKQFGLKEKKDKDAEEEEEDEDADDDEEYEDAEDGDEEEGEDAEEGEEEGEVEEIEQSGDEDDGKPSKPKKEDDSAFFAALKSFDSGNVNLKEVDSDEEDENEEEDGEEEEDPDEMEDLEDEEPKTDNALYNKYLENKKKQVVAQENILDSKKLYKMDKLARDSLLHVNLNKSKNRIAKEDNDPGKPQIGNNESYEAYYEREKEGDFQFGIDFAMKAIEIERNKTEEERAQDAVKYAHLEPDNFDYYKRKPRAKFDVESVISTYSTTDNLPMVISEQNLKKKPQKKQILLSKKTGMPIPDKKDEEEEEEKEEKINENDTERKELAQKIEEKKEKLLETFNDGIKKDETPEERKERKRLVKEMQREKKEQKKKLKETFTKENKKIEQQNSNLGVLKKVAIKY